MKTTSVTCNNCGKIFDKPTNEYKRRVKLNRPMYCSLKCGALKHPSPFGGKRNTIPPINKIKANPFKYYLRNCKRRTNHEYNLTLEYLKELWEQQKGICPYTGVTLVLNTHSVRNTDIRYTASLDRIDSSEGYVIDNVQFISLAINYMKSAMSHEHTLEFLNIIHSNFLKDRTISSTTSL